MLGFAKCVQNLLVLINPLVKLCLKLFLRHAYKEVANQLGDGLTHRPNCNLKHCVDSLSQLLYEDVSASRFVSLVLGSLILLFRDWLTILIILLWHVIGLRHD